MAIFLGLFAAVLWGVADLLTRFAGRAIGAWRTLFYGEVVGILMLTIWLVADRQSTLSTVASTPASIWLLGVVSGAVHLVGAYTLTRGLMIGPISLVMPIIAAYGAISAALSIATGEAVTGVVLVGIVLTVAGTGLASAEGAAGKSGERGGVPWALLSALAYGVSFWLQGRFLVGSLGGLMTVWVILAVGIAGIALLAAARVTDLAPPPREAMAATAGAGALAVAAYVAVAVGFATGQVAVVAVLSSLSSVVTALLGFGVLGERLVRHQWAGVSVIIAGVVLLNVD